MTEQFTAVYGGSFDPPHLGHVMVVSHLLLNDPSVTRVLIVPCFKHAEKRLTPFWRRVKMCDYAFGWLSRVEVSTVECELGGVSFTLRTMQALKQKNPDWNLRFVMGSDLLDTCKTWEGWDELEAIAPPLAIGRAGIAPLRPGDPTPIAPVVSSTLVREALAKNDFRAAERYLPREVVHLLSRENPYVEGFVDPLTDDE